jgi:prepilin-type N-terminal cleavage/methylation domain-containing protein
MMRKKKGFTLIEMVVVLAVVSILVAILVPTIARHIKEAKITRAQNEELVIASAILSLYKDVGRWPCTNAIGPSGGVNRVLSGQSGDYIPTDNDAGVTGSANWATISTTKHLADYLYFNNPDNDSGGLNQNETGQDYPTTGDYRWRGPYLDKPSNLDPWGAQYVISARYFPGNSLTTVAQRIGHRVLVVSAGINQVWETPFADAVNRNTIPDDGPGGDDIGFVIYTND